MELSEARERVDTKHLAQEADHAERYDRSALLHPALVRQCVDEIDSLRVAIAKEKDANRLLANSLDDVQEKLLLAQAKAAPWRENPTQDSERILQTCIAVLSTPKGPKPTVGCFGQLSSGEVAFCDIDSNSYPLDQVLGHFYLYDLKVPQ